MRGVPPSTFPLVPLSPLRGVYRDIALTSAVLDVSELELVGLTVEMDLPEMGAFGTAIVTDIQPCPPIKPAGSSPDAQVVTATFKHPPSTTVLDITFADDVLFSSSPPTSSPQPLGVTDNHLFWSVDRNDFAAIGEMAIGERVLTYHGDTKRIATKLPRPGPQLVYNLEVYGDHVYFVGEEGLLAHNAYNGPTLRKRNGNWQILAKGPSGKRRWQTLRPPKGNHGNTLGNQPTVLYELWEGNRFLKNGIHQDVPGYQRYTAAFMKGKKLRQVARGPRNVLARTEKLKTELFPGQLNLERHAGTKAGYAPWQWRNLQTQKLLE